MIIWPHRTFRARKTINAAIKRQLSLTNRRRASSEPASAASAAADATASVAKASAPPLRDMNADKFQQTSMDSHEAHEVPPNAHSCPAGRYDASQDEVAERGQLMNEDDDGEWHRILVTKTERVSRTRFSLQLRPLVKMKVRDIPRQAIANAIGSSSPSAELAEMAAIRYDDAANSAHITLYDAEHAARLSQTDHLTCRYNGRLETIEVTDDRMDAELYGWTRLKVATPSSVGCVANRPKYYEFSR